MRENKGFIITIIILVLLVLGLGGFIYYDKIYLASLIDESVTVIDDQKVNLNAFSNIYDTLNKLDEAFNDPISSFAGYPYSQKKLEIEKFNPDAAIYASMYSEFNRVGSLQSIAGGTVKYNFEGMFGRNIEYKPKAVLKASDSFQISYDQATDNYSYTLAGAVPYSPKYETTTIKVKLIEDDIVITRKAFFVEYLSNNGGQSYTKATLYTDNSKQNKIGDLTLKSGNLSIKEVIAKYGSKCPTFDYTFKQQDDTTYLLSKIERI